MKALLVITGRGLGGDAVIGLNIIKSLESKGVHCEIALDESAPGLLFKKQGYSWYKISIPQAGGHAATKWTTVKAGLKTINAIFKARKLIKKTKPDVVVGIIGGGAVIGCCAAKLTKVPSVGILSTPLDTNICTRISRSIVFPEAQLFRQDIIPENVSKSYFPVDSEVVKGDKNNGIKSIVDFTTKLKQKNKNAISFDESKKTILFSSGSTLFEKMAKAVSNFSKISDKYNIICIGDPLEEEYLDWFDESKMIYLSYVNWIKDLYEVVDLAILTDDGMMLQEAMVCEVPTIALLKVKYGRYHNMGEVFSDAVIESELDNLEENIENAMSNLDDIKLKVKSYREDILSSEDNISNIIINEIKK